MKRLAQGALVVLALLLTVTSALATTEITFDFAQDTFELDLYKCLDGGSCNNVDFQRTFSSEDGAVTLTLPDKTQGAFYLVFVFAEDTVPFARRIEVTTEPGDFVRSTFPGQGSAEFTLPTLQSCTSRVDDLQLIDVEDVTVTTKPVLEDVAFDVSANVLSPLSQASVIPSGFNYDADGIHPQVMRRGEYFEHNVFATYQLFSVDENNALNLVDKLDKKLSFFGPGEQRVEFPRQKVLDPGKYLASISTRVDSFSNEFCTSFVDTQATAQFEVQDDELEQGKDQKGGEKFTRLQGLDIRNTEPLRVGQAVFFDFDVFSNMILSGQFSTLHSDFTAQVFNPSGVEVLHHDFGVTRSNGFTTVPLFHHTPTTPGLYRVVVTAQSRELGGDVSLPADLPTEVAQVTTSFVVLANNGLPAGLDDVSHGDVPVERSPVSREDSDRPAAQFSRTTIPDAFDLRPGETVFITVSMDNVGDMSLTHSKIYVSIPELGIRRSAGPFSFSESGSRDRSFAFQLPYDVPPGTYYVKIRFHSDEYRNAIWREIRVR